MIFHQKYPKTDLLHFILSIDQIHRLINVLTVPCIPFELPNKFGISEQQAQVINMQTFHYVPYHIPRILYIHIASPAF